MWNFRFTNLTKFILSAVAGVESQPPSSPEWPGPSYGSAHIGAAGTCHKSYFLSSQSQWGEWGQQLRWWQERVTSPRAPALAPLWPGSQGPGLSHWDNPQFVPLTDFVRNLAAGHQSLHISPVSQQIKIEPSSCFKDQCYLWIFHEIKKW